MSAKSIREEKQKCEEKQMHCSWYWELPESWTRCDCCDAFVDDWCIHTYHGSMGKTAHVCITCDLPEGWMTKWSKKRGRPYFVDINNKTVQWGHPTPENPFYKAGDIGEHTRKRVK